MAGSGKYAGGRLRPSATGIRLAGFGEVSLKLTRAALALVFLTVAAVRGQQAVSSITQSRLFTNPAAPGTASFDANGNALSESNATTSGDDSFGAQIILKNQQRPKSFSVFGDAAGFYTNNVDLTPSRTRGDFFLASNVGAAWRPTISSALLAEISAASSVFRYDRARELDFERITAGAGLTWLVPHTPEIVAFARYDFTELLDSASDQLLQDHAFTIGGQRTFAFGRSHYLTTGISGVLGISTPRSQERDQTGIHAAYHLQITRSLDAAVLYRYAAQFYAEDGRVDHNQTLSLAIGFSVTYWLHIDASISAARNDTNRSAFEYDVLNAGSGVRVGIRF